ncbi:MAG: glycosyltransferase [Candidatus Thorarchaeota archaeon]
MRTSIVVPMWNEESWVEQAYNQIKRAIQQYRIDAQIVFATDGCTDRTVEIIKGLQRKDSSIILLNDRRKLGRGLAVTKAFQKLDTPYLVYMDGDLATDLSHLPKLIEYLDKGADVVTGSRWVKDARCVRKQRRKWFSRIYNLMARILFRSKIKDHQCGFKGFNRSTTRTLLGSVKSRGWFWDAEILIRAQRMGLRVFEFPVSWRDRSTKASKVSLWRDARNMGMELVRLRIDLLPEGFFQVISFAMVGVSNTAISLTTLFILENTIGRGYWGYYFAYALGIINSFILNRRFTFKERGITKRTYSQFAGFVAMYIAALVIYSETARFLEVFLGLFYLVAAVMATVVEFVFTFTMSKLAIFRKSKQQRKE